MIEVILSEIVFLYVGFLVVNGKISFVGVVIVGMIGGILV